MAQHLRIFISSPGDVPNERLRADLIIDKLAQDYSRYFSIESYRWEHEPMLASGHFQDAIEPPSASDIVILILWSRLGTPLPERTEIREYHGIDGRMPVTGTEWEFEEALAAARAHGAPDILVFRNVSPTAIDSRDPQIRARSLEQLDALDAFWRRHFANRGMFIAGASEYLDVDHFAARLEESLRKLIERRIKSRAASGASDAATWLGNPFRGLQAYEFEHAAIFFGRDSLVAKAAEQLTSQARAGSAFLLLVGSSGSGKSSLVKAALVPRLMKPQRIEGAAFLRRAIFRPGDAGEDLFAGFVEALTRHPSAEGVGLPELLAPGQTAHDLAAHLRASIAAPAFPFTSALGRVTHAARAAKRILPHESAKLIIVIDQLEELFTLTQVGEEDRLTFVQLLKGLVRSGAVWAVGTMRADFWHLILDVPELVALAEGAGRLDMPALSAAEIAEVIRKPAQAAGLRFETSRETGLGLDTVLAEHAASEPGVLPLLSFTLDALYNADIAQPGGHELTFAQYEHLGGLEGAIAQRADEIVTGLPAGAQSAVPRVLRALATIGPTEMPVARSVPLNNFQPGTDARTVVDAMIEARLLVASSDGRAAMVRLAHEALISRWTRASEQLAADRRDLETRSVIERQYLRWLQSDPSVREQLLLRDPDLANALDLQRRWGDEIGGEAAEFIAKSHQRRRRRQKLAAAAAVIFGIVALAATVFGVIAYQAQQLADQARARAVKAEAVAVTERDQAVQQRNAALISQSRYLGAEAGALVKDGWVRRAIALVRAALPEPGQNNRPLVPDAIVAAYHALYANRERDRIRLPDGATAVAMDRPSQALVVATPDRIIVRPAGSREGERILAHDFGPVARIILDDKGGRAALIGPGGTVSIRDLSNNREIARHPGEGAGTQASFVRQPTRLVIAGADNRIWHLVDAGSGRELARRELPASQPIAAVVDPERGIFAIADGHLHAISVDDLSVRATSTVEPAAEFALALSPEGKALYVAAAKDLLTGRILVLDAETLALQRTFGKVVGGARHIAVSLKATWLAVHGIIGIDFFEIETGERMYHMLTNRDAARGRFLGGTGSDYIAYGSHGFIRHYAPALGVEMASYRMSDGGSIDQIHELADRSGFVAISDRPAATIWSYDAQIISRQHTVPLVLRGIDLGMPSLIEAFAFTSDRDDVLASYADHSARRWNLDTGDVRVVREAALQAESIEHAATLAGGVSVLAEKSGRILIYSDAAGAARPVGEIKAAPLAYLGELDTGRVFVVTADRKAFALDVTTPSRPQISRRPELGSCARQVSVSGMALCDDDRNVIRVWDSRRGQLALEWPAPGNSRLSAGHISRDGTLIAAGYSNGEIAVRSLVDGRTIWHQTLKVKLSGERLKAMAQSPLISEADRARIREGATELEVSLGANALCLSPDGKTLAIAMPDRSIKVVDLMTGVVRDIHSPRRGTGQHLDFSANGALLAAVETGEYAALNVYDVASGGLLVGISLASQVSARVRHLTNGRGFATIDKGGRIVVHPVFENPQDLITYLAREFPEPLTPQQRRAFFID